VAKRSKKAQTTGPIPDDVLDRLYGAAPADFVATRDAAARDLREAGDRSAADAVRALRRPSAPAAAINRAVRAEPAQARALLDAAGDLRRAHEAAMAGERDALKAAAAAERQAVNSLAATAAAQAAGGRSASADVERRIRDTLEAVALDPEVRERFAAGRLEKDARAAGLATDNSDDGTPSDLDGEEGAWGGTGPPGQVTSPSGGGGGQSGSQAGDVGNGESNGNGGGSKKP
jgi:hypothetical protein